MPLSEVSYHQSSGGFYGRFTFANCSWWSWEKNLTSSGLMCYYWFKPDPVSFWMYSVMEYVRIPVLAGKKVAFWDKLVKKSKSNHFV